MTSDGRLIQDSDLPFRWDMVILDELAKGVPVLEEQVRELQRKWKAMTMSNTAYDNLSKIQRWLPALGAFYLGLCKVWGFAFGDEVNQTIALTATLLAITLEISTARYYANETR
ncbi:MAG: hypothetical protein IJJ22_04845 [Oscillospiraceae bacterium]|nr:hypothetical protein [Oscillospiraceae bacterium]